MIVAVASPWASVLVEIDEAPDAGEALAAVFAQHGTGGPVVDRICVPAPTAAAPAVGLGSEVASESGAPAALVVATLANQALLDACPHLAIHAAVLGTASGSLAIPAASGAGKSTLAAAGLLAGLRYVSDEALVIAEDQGVIPYPRPLALSGWSLEALRAAAPRMPGQPVLQEAPSPAQPGASPLATTLGLSQGVTDESLLDPHLLGEVVDGPVTDPLHAILIPRRVEGPPALHGMPRSAGAQALLANAFNHFKAPAAAVALIHRVVAAAEVYALDLGDPAATAQLLVETFGAPLPTVG